MRKFCSLFLLFIILMGVLEASHAFGKFFFPRSPNPEEVSPILSEAGKRRIRQNIAIVDKNIDRVKAQVGVVDQNLRIIQRELDELSTLEMEHQNLLVKYEHYLESSKKVMDENRKAFMELDSTSRKLASKKGEQGSEEDRFSGRKKAMLQAERRERQNWENDATRKVSRIKQLITDLRENKGEINSYREPLQQQLNVWRDKRRGFAEMITKLENKKKVILTELAPD